MTVDKEEKDFKPFILNIQSQEQLNDLMNNIAVSTSVYYFTFGELWDENPDNIEPFSELEQTLRNGVL